MNKNDYKWTVYKHVGPTAKVYVGITCQTPQSRWGKDGTGYKGCPKIWNAIQKYGWDSFRHEIIAENLALEEAQELEIDLIAKYTAQNKTYNIMPGGNSYPAPHPNNHRQMSEDQKRRISESLKGRPKTREHVLKVRAAVLGKTVGYIWIHRNEESIRIPKESFYEYFVDGWTPGRPEFTEEHRRHIGDCQRGRHLSEEHKRKLSESGKGKLKGIIGITKDGKNKRVRESELDKYLNDGWLEGRDFKHSNETKLRLKNNKPKWTQESRAKLSATLRAKHATK